MSDNDRKPDFESGGVHEVNLADVPAELGLLPLRDLLMWGLVPLLRTRGYSALPEHFLSKAATSNLLFAFPLLLLGDGDGGVARLATAFGWA